MSQQKRLNVERLEERVLLAGNVAISVVGATLGLTGDAASNDVSVSTAGGQLTIAGNAGTTLSAGPGAAALLPFIVATDFTTFVTLNNAFVNLLATLPFVTVDFNMLGGNDVVEVDSTAVAGNVVINTGTGNDLLLMDGSSVGGDFTVNMGDGADRAIATFNTWGDGVGPIEAINVNMGAGNDAVSISNSATLGVAGGAVLVVNTGDGADAVNLDNNAFADDVSIDTGAGNDGVSVTNSSGGPLTISTGTGDDQVEVTNDISFSTFGSLTISTGTGVDNVTVRNLDPWDLLIDVGAGGATPQQVIVDEFNAVVGTYTLLGGDQADHFVLTNAAPGTVTGNSIQTFGGNDIVEIANSVVFEVDVDLGAGNDQLIGQNNTGWEGSISGGPGDDAVLLANNQFGFFSASMSIDLGTGNDQLAMHGSTFESGLNLLQINMGSGDDYYVSGGNSYQSSFGPPSFVVNASGGAGSDNLVALDSQPRDQFDAPPNLSGWELIDPDFPA
ncbi:MAG: hypothetical protein ACF8TS_01535 [Maioricimonas sp. JB049]